MNLTEATIISVAGSVHQPGQRSGDLTELLRGNAGAPFTTFALAVDAALRGIAADKLCADGAASPPTLDVTFVELALMTDEAGRAATREALSRVAGAYADASIDPGERRLSATVVWSPRQMLQDQMALAGMPVPADPLPLLRADFDAMVKAYAETALTLPPDEKAAAAERLSPAPPADLAALMIASPQTRRLPFDSSVLATTERLIAASQPGYAAVTILAVERALGGDATPVGGILDIDDDAVRSLYRGDWTFNKPTTTK
ncbi:hypothetical protein DLJ53_10515 [Acuticoccus sediminis]|uniref:Uncharacterized protein n=1 Tax=Acuticoccus sediminis TaxID=2184697 RepID=A0A8B2NZ49_9HYPH|nr:hypothetical protein [Acuticoccus sediminis]RAI01830.1 hypothetical protein DLJ53_10515 [Acuticoccus sediminis]